MAKRLPFGSTLIARPAALVTLRRPRSPSRGVVQVRAPLRVIPALRSAAMGAAAVSCLPSPQEEEARDRLLLSTCASARGPNPPPTRAAAICLECASHPAAVANAL